MAAARVGDIIDDYCPRCRLLTNHTVMALVGEEVRKVICRTCDYSHDYKHGKGAEKKAKPSAKQSAFDQVLASVLAGKSMDSPAVKTERPARAPRSLSQSRVRVDSSSRRPPRPR